jgi:hypothetical protein
MCSSPVSKEIAKAKAILIHLLIINVKLCRLLSMREALSLQSPVSKEITVKTAKGEEFKYVNQD